MTDIYRRDVRLETKIERFQSLFNQANEVDDRASKKILDLHKSGEFQDLLCELGYSSKDVQSKYFKDGQAVAYTRENEENNDVLIEGRTILGPENKFCLTFPNHFYAQISKKEKRSLESNLPYLILGQKENLNHKINKRLNLGFLLNGIYSPLVIATNPLLGGCTGAIAILNFLLSHQGTDVLPYLFRNNTSQNIHHAKKAIEKLDLKYSTDALRTAFTLPQQ